MNHVKVIGAGLAGSEAAWQLAQRGIQVELIEMKPHKKSPAHHTIPLRNWSALTPCGVTVWKTQLAF